MGKIVTTTLACGMPLLVEPMSGVRSLGLTWLLPAGSSRDPADKQGLSAMIAEMLVRGSADLDSREQADAFDALGVSRGTNVETFFISISATMLGSRLKDALPLIVDMVRRPRFEEDAVEPSRDLCIQSVESLKDDPSERLMVMVKERHAPAPINRSALGQIDGLGRVTAADIRQQWSRLAVPRGSVLGIAGDVDPAQAAAMLDELLAGWSGAADPVTWGAPVMRGYHHENDQTNQVHIGVAYDAPSENDPGCWHERVATNVLSGGMSCRLFTEVREKRGLCYSVSASYASDAKFGRTVGYVGTTPDKAQQSLDVMLGELRRVRTAEGAVARDEFERAVIGMKSRLVFSGESSGARASAIARDWVKLGRVRTLEDLTRDIDAVTLDGVNKHLQSRAGLGDFTVVTVGPGALTVK
jgi:predicted Zn-dependent peptidase